MASPVDVDHILQSGVLSNSPDLAIEINRITGGNFNLDAAYNLQPTWSHRNSNPDGTPPGMLLHGSGSERAIHQTNILNEIFTSGASDSEKLSQFKGVMSFYTSASNPNGSAETNGIVAWIDGNDPSRSSSLSLADEYARVTLDDIMQTDAYRDGAAGVASNRSFGATNADNTIIDRIPVYPGSDDLRLDADGYRSHVDLELNYDSSGNVASFKMSGKTFLVGTTALLLVSTAADAADAHGSAALDLGSLALVSYGLYQDGILDDFSISAAVDLIKNSNVAELVGDSLDNLTSEVAIDAALTVAASAFGVGLLWNGAQILQSAAGFDAALSYAAERAPDGHIIQTMGDLVDGAKALFSGGGNVEINRIADLIEQSDPALAVMVTQELSSILNKALDQPGLFQATSLTGILVVIDNLGPEEFNGETSLEAKIKYALGQSYLEEGNVVAFAQLFPDSCFGPEVPIDMWPLDPEFAPDPNNPYKQYDQQAVRAKIWKKPIELIRVGDYVVSHDKNGNMVPGYVPRTFQNNAKILLNFHGTRVTPGHVYYRPDSKKSDKYETLIDVLRDDGMIEYRDGIKLRAATNVPVGDPRDGFVQAVTQVRKADGTVVKNDEGRIRLGTRFLIGEGKERKSWAVADLIERGGGVVGEDELIRVGGGDPMPFLWEFGDTLPKPEDFVLTCSGTTLEDIYKAAEWESQGPRLSAPMVLDRGPVQPLKGAALSTMPRNEPLDVVHSPTASAKPRRTLNRKQRKAMEAKHRKTTKAQKRVAG